MKIKWDKGFRMNRYHWLTVFGSVMFSDDGNWNWDGGIIDTSLDTSKAFSKPCSSAINKFRSIRWLKRFVRKYGHLLPKGSEVVLCPYYQAQAMPSILIK